MNPTHSLKTLDIYGLQVYVMIRIGLGLLYNHTERYGL